MPAQDLLAIGHHGAEFVASEHPATNADPLLGKDGRPAHEDAHQGRHDQHERQEQNQRDGSARDVENSLGKAAEWLLPPAVGKAGGARRPNPDG